MDSLPNELLISSLKLAADAPLPSSSLAPAIPICATLVSARWCAVAELSILGPHLARWRTVAFLALLHELEKFRSFIASALRFPCLESLNLSCTDGNDFQDPYYITAIAQLTALRSLKSNGLSVLGFVPLASMLQALDINLDYARSVAAYVHLLRAILESPACRLTTLVLRNFRTKSGPTWPRPAPIAAHTLRSFAVNFAKSFYGYVQLDPWTATRYECLEVLTNLITMPNLERLEILGGFRGGFKDASYIEKSGECQWPREESSPPLFPHLRELCLEDMCFSPTNLELIQSISPDITHLELIYTSCNQHLLDPDLQWSAVRNLTIEAHEGRGTPWWLQRFLRRCSLDVPYDEMVLSVVPPRHQMALNRSYAPPIRYLFDGPSNSLFDSIAPSMQGFYLYPTQTCLTEFESVDPGCWKDSKVVPNARSDERFAMDDDER
ncbi:hypothetical protein FB45DRAFT_1036264 [Roridomyces roridus]|uniref:Uncharacterized protein n=1 Tax=Roridomyces roridus TaxID=1738132 RepID=A0AAD7FDR4_9AGAR|nr:hypothetical protein FB45DRAFT_1036264 [Roridomyces roridus]